MCAQFTGKSGPGRMLRPFFHELMNALNLPKDVYGTKAAKVQLPNLLAVKQSNGHPFTQFSSVPTGCQTSAPCLCLYTTPNEQILPKALRMRMCHM